MVKKIKTTKKRIFKFFLQYLLRIFEIFKPLTLPLPICRKNLKKISRVHLLNNYFKWKFQNFQTSPFEGMNF